MADNPFAVTCLFRLTIGTHELGSFTRCEGLGCFMEMEEILEGGANDRVWQLPTRLRFTPVALSRPLTAQTALIAAWLRLQAHRPARLPGYLVALGPDRAPLAGWVLEGVVPLRWTGPTFDTEQSQAAHETLEIAHNGFGAVPL
ncbi:phage tail protein [Embleya sp. NPDC059259]|uniref:phage tail protein n=1 Tax=unclassified Embleya TaxID=2699296 RepID=UPI0036ADB85E